MLWREPCPEKSGHRAHSSLGLPAQQMLLQMEFQGGVPWAFGRISQGCSPRLGRGQRGAPASGSGLLC